jgi:hypothetical protein
MDKTKVAGNESKGNIVSCYCNNCGKTINHTVLMDYFEDIKDKPYEYGEYPTESWCDYQIIKCAGCNTISFRKYAWDEEAQTVEDDGSWEELYPESQLRSPKNFEGMPEGLLEIYTECISSYNARSTILCAIGIRALLEGICNEKGIDEKTLEKQVDKLLEQGYISKRNKTILDDLRSLGNDAAHRLDESSLEVVCKALDIIEHIIEDIYDISAKASALEKRQRKS